MKKTSETMESDANEASLPTMHELQMEAIALARLLSFAADEADALEAYDCHLLLSLALRDLKEQFDLKYDDIIDMSHELN
ncbi:MAG: hypothetical protein NW215_13465 [Hyphomicrobiales bacterium]|nr:hypothetical protein [Hyphomicrobiales bacterium]